MSRAKPWYKAHNPFYWQMICYCSCVLGKRNYGIFRIYSRDFFFILLERFEYIPLCNIRFMKCYLVSGFFVALFVCLFVCKVNKRESLTVTSEKINECPWFLQIMAKFSFSACLLSPELLVMSLTSFWRLKKCSPVELSVLSALLHSWNRHGVGYSRPYAGYPLPSWGALLHRSPRWL